MISADPVRIRTRLAELLRVSTHKELNETIADICAIVGAARFAHRVPCQDQRRRCER
jgi:hypothetical protein